MLSNLSHARALFQYCPDVIISDECFPGNTKVATPDGDTPIELLRAGDAVLSDGTSVVPRAVVATRKKPLQKELVRVTHEYGSFVCTENHNIWVEGNDQQEYRKAILLQDGDSLRVLRNPKGSREKGKDTARFCSAKCASEWGWKQGLANGQPLKERVALVCQECQQAVPMLDSLKKYRKFCSTKCAAVARGRILRGRSESRNNRQGHGSAEGFWKSEDGLAERERISRRMHAYNPMQNPETLQKMVESSRGRTFF